MPPPPMDLMSRTLEASSSRMRLRKQPSVPLGRRRMGPEQLQALQSLYDVNTHPSKAQRTQLARELDLDIKAVNIWYQNKRRSMKKKLAAWREAESGTASASTASPRMHPAFRPSPRYTLDFVATSRERTDTRPPLRPRPPVARGADGCSDRLAAYDAPENIYELIPSSPPRVPSSPDAECLFLSGLPHDSKTMRSLEWACAKDRAMIRRRSRESRRRRGDDNMDVPELDLDDGLSSEAETDQLITPDSSFQSVCVPASLMRRSPRKTQPKAQSKAQPKAQSKVQSKAGWAQEQADEEAARMLLAFRGA
ncbi:homeobox domain-containing protein [Phanerochaete sordida]|uniref:Homeobox domain-containing protein n=1 Tax=Phanerochaete sordida TaxID=48140 RepID=A0A9P3G0P8_9APHY|nr:homeobox domain-containing protein [Phanerochaete sordida]